MSEQSERMMGLLQELAVMKDKNEPRLKGDAGARRKRRKQIGSEMKQLADEKKLSQNSAASTGDDKVQAQD